MNIVSNTEFGEIIDDTRLLITNDDVLDSQKMTENRNEYLDTFASEQINKLIKSLRKLETVPEDGTLKKLKNPIILVPKESYDQDVEFETKWEKFAKIKGINKKKRSRKVWDDDTKSWVARWGYNSKSNMENKDWLIEVPENDDPYRDQFEKRDLAAKEKVARNDFKRIKNSEAKKSAGGYKENRKNLENKLAIASRSSASMGKFDKKPKNLSNHIKTAPKVVREKIAFESLKSEKERLHSIMDQVKVGNNMKKTREEVVPTTAKPNMKKRKKASNVGTNSKSRKTHHQ